jgi:hypothetical protein
MRGKLRCRMHGGASTGPRTEAGLQRLRAARTIHGNYAAETRAHDRFLRSFARRSVMFATAVVLKQFLPPVAAARLTPCPPELSPASLGHGQALPSRVLERLLARAEAEALAPWQRAIAIAKAARRKQTIATDALHQLDSMFAGLPAVVSAPLRRPRQDRMHRESIISGRLRSRPRIGTESGGGQGADAAGYLTSSAIVSCTVKRDAGETPQRPGLSPQRPGRPRTNPARPRPNLAARDAIPLETK